MASTCFPGTRAAALGDIRTVSIQLLLGLALVGKAALADPVAVAVPHRSTEPTTPVPADAPAPAPRPDRASGIDTDDEPEATRDVLRGLLFVPRLVVWAALQPVRGAVYVYERYAAAEMATSSVGTNHNKPRFGVSLVGGYESHFGWNVGARAYRTNLLGNGERLEARAHAGGEVRYAIGLGASTGRRFGVVTLDASASFERRPRDLFYGIGNGDELSTEPAMPLDPSMTEVALASRFRQDVLRTVLGVNVRFTDELSTRLSGAWTIRELSAAEDQSIATRFETSKLVGWDTGVDNIYLENELIYDSRRAASEYATQAIDGAGWLVRARGGVGRGLDEDPTRYVRYGGELQRHFDVYRGNRSLALGMMVEAIAGEVAFVDLPQLGGSERLRGYPTGRFRDRAVATAMAEYTWAIANNAAAYTFFDIGAPLSSLGAAVNELGTPRFGYGGGILLHTRRTVVMRAQIAFSRDGDVGFHLLFSSASGRRDRERRW